MKSKLVYYVLHLTDFTEYHDNHCPYYYNLKRVISQKNMFSKELTITYFLFLFSIIVCSPAQPSFLFLTSCYYHQDFSDIFWLPHVKFHVLYLWIIKAIKIYFWFPFNFSKLFLLCYFLLSQYSLELNRCNMWII